MAKRLVAEQISINVVRPSATGEEILKMLDGTQALMKENYRLYPKLKYTVKLEIEEHVKVKCGNCGSPLKRSDGTQPTEAPLYCSVCGGVYNEDGTEFDDSVKAN
jgi:hypothetical protein